MLKSIFAAFVLFGSSMSAQAATGFDVGNEFQATELRGSVSVTCPSRWGGMQTASFQCYLDALDPVEYARFRTDAPVDADAVELKAIHQDGSSRTKGGSYSASKSRSESFNLWIRTLTQKPLLEFGKNTIGYTMKKNKKVVASGTFVANVSDGGMRSCRHEWQSSGNPSDCENGSMVCDRMFMNQNYCQ